MSGIGFIFRWSLALAETIVGPDEKSSPKLSIYIYTLNYMFYRVILVNR